LKLRFGRLAIAVLAAEVLGVLTLVALVALFGPSGGFAAAQPFAERIGAYVGPISGFVFCLLGGYWVARASAPFGVRNGFVTGLVAALLDFALAATMTNPFQWLLVVSNTGRVVGGTLGGLLASRKKA
jgi:hypothetical protein